MVLLESAGRSLLLKVNTFFPANFIFSRNLRKLIDFYDRKVPCNKALNTTLFFKALALKYFVKESQNVLQLGSLVFRVLNKIL